MESKFLTYLESIGVTKALIPRIEYILETLEAMAGEKIIDIFISEYLEEDGSHNYEFLRAFSANTCLGARDFLHEEYYVMWPITKNFVLVNWEIQNYNFISSLPSSRVVLRVSFKYGLSRLELKASQNNCDELFKIFKKYIQPNFIVK